MLHPGTCRASATRHERGYDLNIWAYARIDTVKDGMLDLLRRAGFRWLAFGIEAADEGVLADVDKRYKIEQVYDTIRKVQAADINIIANYIFGLPEDTAESMQRTLDLSLDLNCEFANFYSAMAYPGSPLYEQARREGWALPATWAGYSQHAVDTLPLPTRHLSAGEVLRFRDDAFQRYFTDASYLELILLKFGEDTVAHLLEMSAHKLERSSPPRRPAMDADARIFVAGSHVVGRALVARLAPRDSRVSPALARTNLTPQIQRRRSVLRRVQPVRVRDKAGTQAGIVPAAGRR